MMKMMLEDEMMRVDAGDNWGVDENVDEEVEKVEEGEDEDKGE